MNWNKIGYGTWPLSGNVNGALAYGRTDDATSVTALKTAYESGVNVYDTSDYYGFGHVESLIGEVFKSYRDKITIITKVGMISNEGKQNFSIPHLESSLQQSLKRLKTDYVDVYMLHSPSLETLEDGNILNFLDAFKKNGTIRNYGISLLSPHDGEYAITKCGFKIIEVNYNLLDIRAETNGLLQLCHESDVKVIARTPLAQGILSGKLKSIDDDTDRRKSWPKDKIPTLTRIYKKMLLTLNKNDYTDAQNCLRFCLSNSDISTTIPGMKTPEEVSENVKALTLPSLTQDELTRIKNIYFEEL